VPPRRLVNTDGKGCRLGRASANGPSAAFR